MILAWMWSSDPPPAAAVDIGSGIRLPTYVSGSLSHSWWAMVVVLLVGGSLYLAYIFSYLYLWTVAPQVWPKAESQILPTLIWPVLSGVLLLFSSAAVAGANRSLSDRTVHRFIALIIVAVFALAASLAVEILGHWGTGLRANASGYGAMTYLNSFLQLQVTLPLIVMAAFVLARRLTARLDEVRRVTFDNFGLLWHYVVGQGLLGLLLVHGFPRLVG